jgi:hypothetical protein
MQAVPALRPLAAPDARAHRDRARRLSRQVSHDIAAWADAHNIGLAFVPFLRLVAHRIEGQFQALRYFSLDSTDTDHATQARIIRAYIAWRNRHAHDDRVRDLVNRANVSLFA